ncbi:MAG: type II toxin-antitoxin system RelE/ParE family toxin [Firmicutes bacterium]|nr:type II toxin-antitoxin system RelE/ParE family toxin [Bacillota bacterium]
MSEWKVLLTPEFQQEIRDIHSYIANTLLVPETALNQVRRIMDAVESLNNMPLRHSLYEKEPWRSRGLRKLPVDNFIVFYLPNQKTKDVVIFHVFYGGRNIGDLLK